MNRLRVALLAPLVLNGCMMMGMGGMGTAGRGAMNGPALGASGSGPKTVKEIVVDGIRVSVDFPPYALGDSLIYRVVMYDVREQVPISGATLHLLVTTDADSRASERWPAVALGGGAYELRPVIRAAGSYRLTVIVDRVGGSVVHPPVEIEHSVQLLSPIDHQSGEEGHQAGSRLSPVVWIGAGAMVLMMLFMFR